MAMMLGALYRALLAAHVNEEDARNAAEEVAAYDTQLAAIRQELAVVKWMGATIVTLQIMTLGGLLGLLWKVFPR
jgi:hypothetical protein